MRSLAFSISFCNFVAISVYLHIYMNNSVETYLRKLKENHLSDTKSRRFVFTLLRSTNHTPISMPDLIELAKEKVNRASVYRIIEKFEAAGIVKKIYSGWKYKLELSDEFHGHHHHMRCSICETLFTIQEDETIEMLLDTISRSRGFLMTNHHLEIIGYCQDCQTKSKI